jgi:hypothetical protein
MRLFKKSVVLAVTVMSLIIGSLAFAQDDFSALVANQPQHHKHHHGKKGFFLGMCVGQALLVATPPVALTPGKKLTKDQWTSVKAAKKACIAAFKAAKGSGHGSAGGSGSQSEE